VIALITFWWRSGSLLNHQYSPGVNSILGGGLRSLDRC